MCRGCQLFMPDFRDKLLGKELVSLRLLSNVLSHRYRHNWGKKKSIQLFCYNYLYQKPCLTKHAQEQLFIKSELSE